MKKFQKNLNRRLNELRGLVGIPGQDNLRKLIKKGQNLLDSGASRHEILDFDSEIHKHMIANPIPKDLPKKKKKTKPSVIKTENNIPNKTGPSQKSKYPQSSSRNKKNDSNLKKLLGKAFPSDERGKENRIIKLLQEFAKDKNKSDRTRLWDAIRKIKILTKSFENDDLRKKYNIIIEDIRYELNFEINRNESLVKLPWTILPKGENWEVIEKSLNQKFKDRKNLLNEAKRRAKAIKALDYSQVWIGYNSFNDYHAYEFKNSSKVILESLIYGNATYIISEGWKELSKKEKQFVKNQPGVFVVRHDSSMNNWLRTVRAKLFH